MHISSNEAPFQNQLTTNGVTHKFIYTPKPLNFINVGQTLVSYSNIIVLLISLIVRPL